MHLGRDQNRQLTGELTIETRGANRRDLKVNTNEFQELKLAYAQHVYKAQGLTVDRAHTLIGGWQTDRERAYVALSRSTERTDIHLSRDDLGEQGMAAGTIERLAETIERTNTQQASITHEQAEQDRDRDKDRDHENEHDRDIERDRQQEADRDIDRDRGPDLGWGIE